jgi:hypothetical protein
MAGRSPGHLRFDGGGWMAGRVPTKFTHRANDSACGADITLIRWRGIDSGCDGDEMRIREPALFGDRGLEAGWVFLQHRLLATAQQGVQVRTLGGNRANEMRIRRFLHNPSVTSEDMIETALAHTSTLVSGRHILAIQETTSLRDDGQQSGHSLHPMIAVDAHDGTLLGVVAVSFLLRRGKQTIHCNKRLFAEKESARWLEATQEAAKLAAAGAACVTVVADRECDIYDEFALRPAATELLIRCHHNRLLADGTRLFARTRKLVKLGCIIVPVPAAREAKVALYVREVTLPRPKRNRAAEAAKLPPALSLTYGEAREITPPEAGGAAALAAADHPSPPHPGRGAADRRLVQGALDHRAGLPGDEDPGLRP